jgi:hypothetical protein
VKDEPLKGVYGYDHRPKCASLRIYKSMFASNKRETTPTMENRATHTQPMRIYSKKVYRRKKVQKEATRGWTVAMILRAASELKGQVSLEKLLVI